MVELSEDNYKKLPASNRHLYYVLHGNVVIWTARSDVYVDVDRGVQAVSGELHNIEYL